MPLMCRVLDIPVRVLAAWGHDEYRKSSTGMWDALVREWNGGVQVGAFGEGSCERDVSPANAEAA